MNKMPKVGDSVCYQPEHLRKVGKFENGVVKFVSVSEKDACWVVYNCGGEWHKFMDYTAAKTKLTDLKEGWMR